MGVYVNPTEGTKEQFLDKICTKRHLFLPPEWKAEKGQVLVCLVDNGAFTAAGVCYSEGEYAAFTVSTDKRSKVWFEVPLEDLQPAISPGDYSFMLSILR